MAGIYWVSSIQPKTIYKYYLYCPRDYLFIHLIQILTIGTQCQSQYLFQSYHLIPLLAYTLFITLLLFNPPALVASFASPDGYYSFLLFQAAGRNPCNVEESIFSTSTKTCLWSCHIKEAASESRCKKKVTNTKRPAPSRVRKRRFQHNTYKRARKSTPIPIRTIPRSKRYRRGNGHRHRCFQHV